MMTLDQAITHAEEIAREKEWIAEEYEADRPRPTQEINKCYECAAEHRQLAEWLKELQRLRNDR